jgi:demethylspheroidene O-methyltransferase
VLLACVRLRLFDHPARRRARVAEALATLLDLPPEGAERLLRAAAALDLVTPRDDGRWALGPLGAAMIGNPGIAAMVEHHALLYADLADPVALLRRPAWRQRAVGLLGLCGRRAGRGARPAEHRRTTRR